MRWSKIRLLVLDFDGVMTDNLVYTDETGREAVCCSRSDGLGIGMVKDAGVEVLVFSKEENRVVAARCRKLRIRCVQKLDDKVTVLKREIKKRSLTKDTVCYVGNDVNDIECMKIAGLSCAVADAYPKVKQCAYYVTKQRGGRGAVREICDKIISARS